MASTYRQIGVEIDFENHTGEYFDNKGYIICSINFNNDEMEFHDEYEDLTDEEKDVYYNELLKEYNRGDDSFTYEDYEHFNSLIYK